MSAGEEGLPLLLRRGGQSSEESVCSLALASGRGVKVVDGRTGRRNLEARLPLELEEERTLRPRVPWVRLRSKPKVP